MSDTVTVTSQIPTELAALLARVAEAEERSKSYYIKKGLELILQQRLEDLEDYEAAVQAHATHLESGEPALSMDDVFGRE
jgi:predicted DNA-binding protein